MLTNLRQQFVLICLLGIFSLSSTGCWLLVGAAAGAGGVIWVKGRLAQELNAPLDRVHAASLKALEKMELPLIIDQKDKLSAKIESEFSDRARVRINIKSITTRSSRIEIRVGTLGDEQRSRQILDNIEHYL